MSSPVTSPRPASDSQRAALPAVLLFAGVALCISTACVTAAVINGASSAARDIRKPPAAPMTPPPTSAPPHSLELSLRECLPGASVGKPDLVPGHLVVVSRTDAAAKDYFEITAVGRFDWTSARAYADQVAAIRARLTAPPRFILLVYRDDGAAGRTFITRFDLP